jgi:hypothetical protein
MILNHKFELYAVGLIINATLRQAQGDVCKGDNL